MKSLHIVIKRNLKSLLRGKVILKAGINGTTILMNIIGYIRIHTTITIPEKEQLKVDCTNLMGMDFF